MYCRTLLLAILGLVPLASAGPPSPPPPQTYEVAVRYRIDAAGTARVLPYRATVADLVKAGFERTDKDIPDTEPIDPDANRMNGLIASRNVPKLLQARHVRTVLLTPKDSKFPDKGGRVRVELSLASGYLATAQRKLWRQTSAALEKIGFVEAFGYDNRDYSRLVGSVTVENLEKLLDDVRELVPRDDREAPLRDILPVRIALARPDWPVPAGRPKEEVNKQAKFTPDLRAALGDDKVQRLEVILANAPSSNTGDWRRDLERSGAVVEGRLGPVVTVSGMRDDKGARPPVKELAEKLALLDEVLTVRLPRSGRELLPAGVPQKWEAVRARSGLAKLHDLGCQGEGTRLAVISDDFAGWEKLPGKRTLVDLTAERSPDLQPDPYATVADKGIGVGTRSVQAILKAAPKTEVTLIRVDPTTPYMLELAARAINGERIHTLGLEQRLAELLRDRGDLDIRRKEVEQERIRALDGATQTKEGMEALARYRLNQKRYDDDEEAYRVRFRRYAKLSDALRSLKGVRVVASTLVWHDGYPVDGSSALSRYFDDRPFRAALWFQAVGDTAGQAWTGPYRDVDANERVEMGQTRHLPPEAWTTEVNFLNWDDGKGKQQIPAGTKLRLTLQWREAHDPLPVRVGEDPYRQPLARLKLLAVYQPDPRGESRPADDLVVQSLPAGTTQRLSLDANSATYEYVLDLEAKVDGRYGVLIEGLPPESIHPAEENLLPMNRKKSELNLRLFVKTLTPGGRATWATWSTRTAALGMPADAREVFAVAGATEQGTWQPSSAAGPAFGQPLSKKPEVLAADLGEGTGMAASVAAGFSAAAWGNKGGMPAFAASLRERSGSLLRCPK